jgi:hypothetical protein
MTHIIFHTGGSHKKGKFDFRTDAIRQSGTSEGGVPDGCPTVRQSGKKGHPRVAHVMQRESGKLAAGPHFEFVGQSVGRSVKATRLQDV